jgi:hypothetical protein
MNSNFKELSGQFADQWQKMSTVSNLNELRDEFSHLEEIRENILIWVFENTQDEEEQGNYFSTFGELESSLAESSGGIPIFDEEFDIYDSFDEYESYYQRYGCMVPEYVISWDETNVLWADEMTIDLIKRPDVLMAEAQ